MVVYGIITCYNPTCENIGNIKILSSFVKRCFVIDSSEFEHDFSKIESIKYIHTGYNMGLSKGFNFVLKKYKFKDSDFIMFFDQDSTYDDNHIKFMCSEFERIQTKYKIGCLSPIIFNSKINDYQISDHKITIDKTSYSVQNVITSSLLTKYKILKEVNFWDEFLFLDMSDWYLSWKLLNHGCLTIVTTKTYINHFLGDGRIYRFGIPIDKCSPIRDGCKLLFKKTLPRKKLLLLYILFPRSLLYIFFLDNKKKRLFYILHGFRDFFCQKNGEYQ